MDLYREWELAMQSSNPYSAMQAANLKSLNAQMFFGKPFEWWLQIEGVLQLHGIKDHGELEKRLPAMPTRAPDDWSGY